MSANSESSAVATRLKKSVFFLLNIYLFIYLDALGRGGGKQDLWSLLWHVKSLVVAFKLLVTACGI